jgi:hypothetical protein
MFLASLFVSQVKASVPVPESSIIVTLVIV